MEPFDLFFRYQRDVSVYFVSSRGEKCRAVITSTGISVSDKEEHYPSFSEWLHDENDGIVCSNPLTNIFVEGIFGYDVTLYDLQRFIRLQDMRNCEVAIVATYMQVTGYLKYCGQTSFGIEMDDSTEVSCYVRFTLNDVASIVGKTIYLKG